MEIFVVVIAALVGVAVYVGAGVCAYILRAREGGPWYGLAYGGLLIGGIVALIGGIVAPTTTALLPLGVMGVMLSTPWALWGGK